LRLASAPNARQQDWIKISDSDLARQHLGGKFFILRTALSELSRQQDTVARHGAAERAGQGMRQGQRPLAGTHCR
jgi:hypothetical protein